jgi:hypothetical protein
MAVESLAGVARRCYDWDDVWLKIWMKNMNMGYDTIDCISWVHGVDMSAFLWCLDLYQKARVFSNYDSTCSDQ